MYCWNRVTWLFFAAIIFFYCCIFCCFSQEKTEAAQKLPVTITEESVVQIESESVVVPQAVSIIPESTVSIEKPVTNDDQKISDVIDREQTIYVPYEKLKNTFESEGRGVFLPYDQFRQLWDAAQAKNTVIPPEIIKAPIPVMVTETENTAKINGDLVEVTATIKYDILEIGWHEIPLSLKNTAIIEAKINGEAAQLLGNSSEGFRLLVQRKKDAPVRGELLLRYAKNIEKSPGRNSVSFDVPQAPMSRWEFRVPDLGTKVDFLPMIAASELPTVEGNEETIFRAFAGSAPTIQIGWTPKAEGATGGGLETMANVQTLQHVTIQEGVVRNHVQLQYMISRGQLDRLVVELPTDQRIIGVFDDNIRSWNISQSENVQVVQVELFESAKSIQNLIVETEKFLPVENEQSVEVPQIKIIGVGGHQGLLSVDAATGMACEQKKLSGLIQIDPTELPQELKIKESGFAYRLTAPTYDLELAVAKEKPRIFAKSEIITTLNPNDIDIQFLCQYRIKKEGVFQFFYDIPADYNVVGVHQAYVSTNNRGEEFATISIEGHQLSDLPIVEGQPKMKRLTVNLNRKAIGNVRININLHKTIDYKELQIATEKSVDLKFDIPTVAGEFIEQKDGMLAVVVPDFFRVTETKFVGLQSVPINQLHDKWLSQSPQGNMGYVFAQEQPELTLQVMRRTPQVTIKQIQIVRIDDGIVRFTANLQYNILYSGVKSIRVDVPKSIAKLLRNQTKELRDAVLVPQPEDVAEGYEAWEFSKGNEIFGNGVITLVWEKQIPQLLDGKNVAVQIPRLVPQHVFRHWGQILLTKSETIDLSSTDVNEGVRQIDPQHDMDQNDRVQDAAYAFEYHDDWKLTVKANRYELQEVKRASVECGMIRAVLTRGNTTSVQALYRIQSVKQRLPIVFPENAQFNVEPKINGVPVTLETDATNQYLIPLNSTIPNQPFILELRYTQKNDQNRTERKRAVEQETIAIPVFPDEPAVQHLYLAVYVPDEYALGSYNGMCSKNFKPLYSRDNNRINVANQPDIESLIRSVQTGSGQNIVWDDFPCDGTPYLFSTIQPDHAMSDLLKISMIKLSGFNVICLVVIMAAGIGLTRYRWRIRIIGVFVFLVLFAMLALCAPTFAFIALILAGTRWAMILTLVLWLFWSLMKWWDIFKTKLVLNKTNVVMESTVNMVSHEAMKGENNEQ